MIVNKTIILHSGYYLNHMGRLNLAYDGNDRKIRILNKEKNIPYFTLFDSTVAEDPQISNLINQYGNHLSYFVKSYTNGLVKDFDKIVMQSSFPLVKEKMMEYKKVICLKK